MVTRLDVDSELLQAAIALDHAVTTDTIVEKALRKYIRRHQGANAHDALCRGFVRTRNCANTVYTISQVLADRHSCQY